MIRKKILMIDAGGTNIKLMISGGDEVRKIPSGPKFTAEQMAAGVRAMTKDWKYDAITLGYAGLVEDGKLVREPLNLGGGWVGFDYEKALGKPVRFINDASMQALANYKGGRMLFMSFGTSTGASLITHDVIVPLEIGLLRFSKRARFMDRLAKEFLKRAGKRRWMRYVLEAVAVLQDVFKPTDTVIGGGNAKLVDPLPAGSRLSSNKSALKGAERLWPGADMLATPAGNTWRISRKERAS